MVQGFRVSGFRVEGFGGSRLWGVGLKESTDPRP